MLTLTNCKVVDEEGAELDGALIIASGDSPNATVRISMPDKKYRKFRHHDRVLNASIKGAGDKWTIEGLSEQLLDEVRVDRQNAKVTLKVTARGGCKGCR